MAVHIRRITLADDAAFRAVRLAALRESPSAFGSTYEREAAFTDAQWSQRLTNYAAGERAVGFLALDDAGGCGLVGGIVDDQTTDRAWVVSMWVSPRVRGRGVGTRLLDGVIGWARERGFAELMLEVTVGNKPAMSLYLRAGFTPTGQTRPHPHRAGLEELTMRLTPGGKRFDADHA